MCLISTEIESVTNTKILVAPNHNNTRQLTVYANYVNNISESNAMVLPVPLPQTLQFINLSGYKDLFEDCAKCFYNPNKSLNYSNSLSTNSSNSKDDKPLQVFNIGSYQVSVAMNLEQIEHVDSKVFILSPGLKQTLQRFYYQEYWGFIICKLNSGHESYHPIAYSHQIIDSKIYIPTRHYHQEVKWAEVNNWALGTHIDPKENPLNAKSWNEDNINQSPMFRIDKFGMSSPQVNGWLNQPGNQWENQWENQPENQPENQWKTHKTNLIGGISSYNTDDFSSNNFETPTSRFGLDTDNTDYQRINSSQSKFKTNSIANMSSKYENLRKLNNTNYKKSTQSNQSISYKDIADDWSHSIYLMNLNSQFNKQISQLNSCKEIWDHKTLFDPKKIKFDFGRCNNFEKIKIEGTYPNIDLVIPISA
jgi:hypothetical protein